MSRLKGLSADWGLILDNWLRDRWVAETCLDCHGCTASRLPVDHPRFFNNRQKCCSFWPFIPNYQVSLLWQNAFAAEVVNLWMAKESCVSPLGILPSRDFQRRQQQEPSQVTCPYLMGSSLCAIWSMRPSRCATFHCLSQEGESGTNFWEAVDELGNYFEQGLAQAWMVEAGFRWSEVETMREFLVPDKMAEDFDFGKAWAHWRGREKAYFEQASKWRISLSKEALANLLGQEWIELQKKAGDLHGLTSWGEGPRPQP